MKKTKKYLSLFLLFNFVLSLFLFNNNNKSIKAITSNVDDSYYESVRGLQKDELKEGLYNIIKGHKMFSYGSNINDIMKVTDADPYNEDNIILVYTGSVSKNTTFNKEHVWAKSHGDFGTTKGPGTDLHHLRPCYINLNSTRGNLNFAEGGTEISNYPGNYINSSAGTFEPSDEFKGDVARMIFYMATRYEGTEVINGVTYNFPDLEVVDYVNNGKEATIGLLSDLLKWNLEDPVSEYEINRNNIIYSDYQGNRNPFIDHPEFVNMIFDESYEGSGALEENTINKTTVEETIKAIDDIGNVTLNSEKNLKKAENCVKKLTDEELKSVTNLDTLKAKRYIFDKLKEYENYSLDALYLSYDLTNNQIVNGSYKQEVNFTIDGKDFYTNCVYTQDNEFRLGYNANNASVSKLDLKYQELGFYDGALLEMNFDIDYVYKIEFVSDGTKYGTINNFNILYSLDSGKTYSILKTGTDFKNMQGEQELENVRFSFILTGSNPRMCLSNINIYQKNQNTTKKEVLIFNDLLNDIKDVNEYSNSLILAAEIYLDNNSEIKELVDVNKLINIREQFNNLNKGSELLNNINSKIEDLNILLESINLNRLDKIYNVIKEIDSLILEYNLSGGNVNDITNYELFNDKDNIFNTFFLKEITNLCNKEKNINNYNTLKIEANDLKNIINNYNILYNKNINITELDNLIIELNNLTTKENIIIELNKLIDSLKGYVVANGISKDTKSNIQKEITNIEQIRKQYNIEKDEITNYNYLLEVNNKINNLSNQQTGCNMNFGISLFLNLLVVGFFIRRKEY